MTFILSCYYACISWFPLEGKDADNTIICVLLVIKTIIYSFTQTEKIHGRLWSRGIRRVVL